MNTSATGARSADDPKGPPPRGGTTYEALVLTGSDLEVTITPGKGADIVSLVDRATGIDVLFRTPWAGRAHRPPAFDSQAAWLASYQGGWQVLCPNAGPQREVHHTTWGFHGEAALVPWRVERCDQTSARLETQLFSAPLTMAREISIDGRQLHLAEAVANESDVPIEIMWVHHPAFGPPLISEGCRLEAGARVLIADAQAPGTELTAGSVHTWPPSRSAGMTALDAVPGDAEPREVLAYLSDFTDGWYRLANERLGLGVELRWDTEVFPHAWLWQELRANPGFPWYRRACAFAVEPANTIPGAGEMHGLRLGSGSLLGPHDQLTTQLTLTVVTV